MATVKPLRLKQICYSGEPLVQALCVKRDAPLPSSSYICIVSLGALCASDIHRAVHRVLDWYHIARYCISCHACFGKTQDSS